MCSALDTAFYFIDYDDIIQTAFVVVREAIEMARASRRRIIAHAATDLTSVDMVFEWLKRKPDMALRAFAAREKAVHWATPPFQVGCCALGFRPGLRPTDRYVESIGANFKPKEGKCGPRCCGEDQAEATLLAAGCNEVIAMAIASPQKVDDFSGVSWRKVNPPCGYCRWRWGRSLKTGGIIKPHTRLYCINVNTWDSVTMTVAELLQELPQTSNGLWVEK